MMSAVTLTVGISLAYYNTCSLAFIASVDDDNITFLDFSVSRKELKKIKKDIENILPKESINM